VTDPKEVGYYGLDRSELYDFARRAGVRVTGPALNVGCAGGADAPHLRGLGATRLHGVEPVASAARTAAKRYDAVDCCPVDAWTWDRTRYDLIVLADVLEHLADPVSLLRRAGEWLSPEGTLLLSVPNVRHVSVLWSLVVRGDWRYREEGILDDTHLRFFTSKSFRRLLVDAGYRPVAMDRFGLHRAGRSVSRVVPSAGELLLSQIFAVARPAAAVVVGPPER
jgi:O-antigen biosynthesis protein